MIPCHIERLKLNSRELYFNIQQMQEKGRSDKAAKLKREKANLDACIQDISTSVLSSTSELSIDFTPFSIKSRDMVH